MRYVLFFLFRTDYPVSVGQLRQELVQQTPGTMKEDTSARSKAAEDRGEAASMGMVQPGQDMDKLLLAKAENLEVAEHECCGEGARCRPKLCRHASDEVDHQRHHSIIQPNRPIPTPTPPRVVARVVFSSNLVPSILARLVLGSDHPRSGTHLPLPSFPSADPPSPSVTQERARANDTGKRNPRGVVRRCDWCKLTLFHFAF